MSRIRLFAVSRDGCRLPAGRRWYCRFWALACLLGGGGMLLPLGEDSWPPRILIVAFLWFWALVYWRSAAVNVTLTNEGVVVQRLWRRVVIGWERFAGFEIREKGLWKPLGGVRTSDGHWMRCAALTPPGLFGRSHELTTVVAELNRMAGEHRPTPT